ncbi:MAG: hypothetical protein ABSA21_05705 [Candidatus Limnocylindrales bacterium]|jgi:hypothetical protein
MRKLTLALAIGLLVVGTGVAAGPVKAAASSYQTKVVIVVGQTQSATARYISDANQAAAEFANYTTNIVEVYSPHATWSAVKAAAKGANILVYMGHGSGYPNPYVGYLQPNSDDGMGLDGPTANVTYYFGENYMAQLDLAPNALVILNHLCYASGNNEPGLGLPSVSVAHTRIDGYASGFIRGGARAVIAEALNSISYYIDTVFTGHTTVDAMWKSAPSFNDNVVSWTSTQNPGFTSESDPSLGHPNSDGDVYYRSMVSIPSTSTDSVISGQIKPFVARSGSYYPLAPTRVVDTRPGKEGPVGSITAGGGYYYQIAGVDGIPSNAIAITANVTVTSQTAAGFVYIGPSVDSSPGTSTINFPKGDNRANGVTVALSPQGTVGVWYGAPSGKTTNLIIDVTGYFLTGTAGAGYVKFGPNRVLDTRPAGNIGLQGQFPAGQHRKIQIAGVAGLPLSGIVAVTGNLTVVKPSAKGYVTIGPNPTDTPGSSTINFPAGDIRANNVVVPVNSDGTLSAVYIAPAGATVDLVLDISGYFTASGGALYNTLAPARILDSRYDTGVTGPFGANTPKTLQVTGHGGVPSGALAITANLTVTAQTYAGFAAVGPSISSSTTFSTLNFPKGDNRANGVTVPLAGNGSLQLVYVAPPGRTAQLILDVSGYYLGAA